MPDDKRQLLAALQKELEPLVRHKLLAAGGETNQLDSLQRLLDQALTENPDLADIRGYADDTGEGRWTVNEGIRLAVPMNVIAAALFARFASRQEDSPAMKAVAALRSQFGGHAVKRS